MAKLICGILRLIKGVFLEGVNYLNYSIRELGQNRLCYAESNQMLVKDIVKEEVSLGLVLNNRPEEEIEKNIEEAMKKCDIWPMRNWPISVVSYGQKKRV